MQVNHTKATFYVLVKSMNTKSQTLYEPPFVLAIDIGSSSIKAALFDSRAYRIEGTEFQDHHPLHSTSDGAAEESCVHIVERVEAAIDSVLERAGDASKEIVGVGVDTLASTLIGVDKHGQPLTPIYTYADTRSRDYVKDMRANLDTHAVYQRTGCPQHTAYLPAQIRWLQNICPEIVRLVYRWLDVGTFLYTRWFGKKDIPTSYSIASWTGLLDRHRMCWDEELLHYLSISVDSLSPLSAYSHFQTGLAQPFATRWPILSGIPFALGVGDGVASNVGSGCVAPNRVALSVGTTGAMRVFLPYEVGNIAPGLWVYRVGKYSLLGGAFSEGGNFFVWANDTLKLPPVEELDAELSSLPPDGHGLTMLPFLAGERSPGFSDSVGATITGINTSTTALEVMQVGLESIAYRFGLVGGLLQQSVNPESKIIASGGAIINSRFWLQMMSDILQQPLDVCTEKQATSRGAAILALHALNIWPALDTVLPELGDNYEPDHERAFIYQRGLERHQRLYGSMLRPTSEFDQIVV